MPRKDAAVRRSTRLDHSPTSRPPGPHREVKAVQVDRPQWVTTRDGTQFASVGQWLVTEADGSVQVYSDRAFRLQALRQQLLRMLAGG
jgi:hypothetical protein